MAPKSVEHVDGLLADLSSSYTVGSQGSARLVAGPTGVFVVVIGGDDVGWAAELAARLAPATRSTLADHLSWVPFVDAVVVTDTGGRRGAAVEPPATEGATAVPVDLLGEVLVEGRAVVELSVLDVIDDLLRADALGPWKVGIGGGPAKIDLCEPTADTSATA